MSDDRNRFSFYLFVWEKKLKTMDNTDLGNREEFSWLLDLPLSLPVTHYMNTGFSLNVNISLQYYCKE
jgi:hypothetical protein